MDYVERKENIEIVNSLGKAKDNQILSNDRLLAQGSIKREEILCFQRGLERLIISFSLPKEEAFFQIEIEDSHQ